MPYERLKSFLPRSLRPTGYLSKLVRRRTKLCVRAGPFRGMRYLSYAIFSAYVPKLLGIYEKELHSFIERACALNKSVILDIGAAEGYYAVGMARRNPQSQIIAYETEERGRKAIREMAALNDVEARVVIRGKCEPKDLRAALAQSQGALIVCDIEGGEMALLEPEQIPHLKNATILVELHDHILPGSGGQLRDRFASTHHITHIWQEDRTRADFPFTTWYTRILPWSRLESAAVSEWRPGRMSWLWMEPIKQKAINDELGA